MLSEAVPMTTPRRRRRMPSDTLRRALLERVFEDAQAPVYLDTANPANVPYYAGFGFEELGRAALPRGATMWFMRRA